MSTPQGVALSGAAERRNHSVQEAIRQVPMARRSHVERRARDTPETCRLGYVRAAVGIASPRAAIKAFCLACVGWDRKAVAQCTALACPLYANRPFRASSP